MKLSDFLDKTGCDSTLVSDGEFDTLEQCTRIRRKCALTFLENPKYASFLEHPAISCLLCTPDFVKQVPAHIQGIIVTKTPKLAFFKIHNYLADQRKKLPTVIDPSASISPQAYVSPYNVHIGKNVEIHPFAVINENTTIQDNVRICSGTIIGEQGFSAVQDPSGGAFLVHDGGYVLIEEGVEICSGCHIACGMLENDVTTIGAYTKFDALIHIAHGVTIGKNGLLTAGVIIGGNCVIGDYFWAGLNATISNRITIGNHVRVSLGAVVTKDVPDGAIVTGNFAIPHQLFLRNLKASLVENT